MVVAVRHRYRTTDRQLARELAGSSREKNGSGSTTTGLIKRKKRTLFAIWCADFGVFFLPQSFFAWCGMKKHKGVAHMYKKKAFVSLVVCLPALSCDWPFSFGLQNLLKKATRRAALRSQRDKCTMFLNSGLYHQNEPDSRRSAGVSGLPRTCQPP